MYCPYCPHNAMVIRASPRNYEFDSDVMDSPTRVADFHHLVADIGRYLVVKICLARRKLLCFPGFRERMKFGTVVALAV